MLHNKADTGTRRHGDTGKHPDLSFLRVSASPLLRVFLLLTLAASVHAALWSGILDPSRAADWSTAGVQGGIPNRTTICQTIAPYTGSANTLNTAIGNCPSGQVVQLAAGTFNLSNGIELDKSNVTLRGMGADATILKISGITNVSCHIGGGRVVNLCTNGGSNIGVDSPEHTATWTAGYAKGTTVITLSNTTGLTVGHTLWLDQLDDPSDGYPAAGDIYMCDNGAPNCANNGTGESFARTGRGVLEGQIVTAISGNQVTLSPGVGMPHIRASQSPGAWWGNSGTILTGAGLEDMTIDATPSLADGIYLVNATNSWVKGVRVLRNDTSSSEVRLLVLINAMNDTVTHSYFYGPVTAQLVSTYGLATGPMGSSLIQNNIFHTNTSPIVMNSPFYGNVAAYNYFDNTPQASVILHGIGAMNLYEGNNGANFSGDSIHSSHGFETTFRNHWDGRTHNLNANETQAAHALYSNNRFFNLIGNVQGTPHWTAYQSLLAHNPDAIYELGWQGTGSGTPITNDSNVNRTLMRWGNWDSVNNATRFLASEVPSGITNFPNSVPASQSLPASFYLSTQPGWWSTPWGTPKWPAIGPDVTGGNVSNSPTGGHADKIPARLCFENTAVDPAYPSSNPRIKLFNAATCYGAGSPPANACDVNGSGATDVSDVQLCVNQAIGISGCSTGDINQDSQCNVVDVQRVVNSALGGSCVGL